MFSRQQAPSQSPQLSGVSPAAIEAASPLSDGSITVQLLFGSITGPKGEQLTEVRLRAPKGGDWMECGDYQTMKMQRDDAGRDTMVLEINQKAAGAWLQRLSSVPLGLLNQLDYRDFKRVFQALTVLVGPDTKGN